MRVLAVADADSYLKWSAATLDRLPAGWRRHQVLLVSPIAPSPDQTLAAAGSPIARLGLGALARLVRSDPHRWWLRSRPRRTAAASTRW